MSEKPESLEIGGETAIDTEEMYAALRECYDPEIPVNIVDLGLVYNVHIEGPKVGITMTLTSAFCPVAPGEMAEGEEHVPAVANAQSCELQLTFHPPCPPTPIPH